ncbi:tautomerase family protein [Streptomyces beihaiensis]|uniref:Isomerase n=1 Tax=Streptomyces beihaiensis TaxID=2984495 RepID=A0ABT3U173_9ACTN|nr:isomerase [Streptomyces beihaiensis]MCX3062805.1 isomerase [Streptomyces beihaiensis]
MPQITVDYSAGLGDRIDRPALAGALHAAAVEHVAARTAACKTRFRRADATVAGEAAADLVHVEIALLAGRTEEAKAALADAVLAALPGHIEAPEGVHLSAEVRDLEPAYRSAIA